jgi:Flp pilus assembly protein TadB
MGGSAFGLVVLGVLALLAVMMMLRGSARTAEDVMRDLGEIDTEDAAESYLVRQARAQLSDPLVKAGLFSADERRRFELRGRLFPIFGAALGVISALLGAPGNLQILFMFMGIGLFVGFVARQSRLKRLTQQYSHKLEFFLPVVMERLVMAVQSGLDILAALGAIIELESAAVGGEEKKFDPVTRLFMVVHRLAERGLTFGQALEEVAAGVECGAVRHCFIHLAVAHEEGGELVMPLKELSDSTQLYYQETVDEEIAKLPVKATMPLLLTFAGLILLFLTSPLVQVTKLFSSTSTLSQAP